jgi:Salmonella virulence plasmid 65kDa B protein
MLSSSIRIRSFFFFALIVIFSFYLEIFPTRTSVLCPEAIAQESETDQKQEPPPSPSNFPPDEPPPDDVKAYETSTSGGDSLLTESAPEPQQIFNPQSDFDVDDFTGAAHLKYPIQVPPARAGLAPKLVIDYNSYGKNGWLGVGFDLPIGFIQRMGPRKSVPKYNDTDTYYLSLGERSLHELVSIATNEYRQKIEGPFNRIKYYPTGNYGK